MNRKFYFSFLAFALTLAMTVAFVVGHSSRTSAASTNAAALSALPASDFIISIDVQRALNETLPSLLSGNPALLAKLNAHLQEFEQKTGISPRVFETVAIGSNLIHPASSGRRDAGSVIIVRGSFKAAEMLDTAFASAKKECQFEKEEQQYEGKTIFLIGTVRCSKDAGKDAAPAVQSPPSGSGVGFGPGKDSKPSSLEVSATQHSIRMDAAISSTDKFAVSALDSNTIAVGSPESVRAAIDASMGRNRVDDELVQLATQTPNAVVSYSGRIPRSAPVKANSHSVENPFAKYFDSIREFYGSFNVNGGDAESSVTLRTENADEARDISQAINALKGLAFFGLGQSTGRDAGAFDAFATALKGMSVTAQDNEVRIDAKIPQASLAPLMRLH
ncbi:MAG: hypothetical protein QOJ02_4136 [Acidobacteriota bacterium]|jgi:hypothetical protein|nr:hypothetical protein [Acidobacteriota bacterium]